MTIVHVKYCNGCFTDLFKSYIDYWRIKCLIKNLCKKNLGVLLERGNAVCCFIFFKFEGVGGNQKNDPSLHGQRRNFDGL